MSGFLRTSERDPSQALRGMRIRLQGEQIASQLGAEVPAEPEAGRKQADPGQSLCNLRGVGSRRYFLFGPCSLQEKRLLLILRCLERSDNPLWV